MMLLPWGLSFNMRFGGYTSIQTIAIISPPLLSLNLFCSSSFFFQFLGVENWINDLIPFFFSNVGTAVTVFHKFLDAVFSFSFSSLYYLISFENLSLIHGLFRSVLFSFQMFGDFFVFFLLLIPSLILQNSLNIFCIENVVYLGVFF